MPQRKNQDDSDDTVQTADTAQTAWKDLGLDQAMLAAVRHANFLTPTEIQCALIPAALADQDCLGQAQTGTGKTAAFAIPVLQRITPGQRTQALVLVPTRELAAQVDEHVRVLAVSGPVKTVLIYGGRNLRQQTQKLKAGPEIVIGTPGRILDLMGRGQLDFASLRYVVLDEVDRMLDIGFRDDIRRILRTIKTRHQTIFVSATIDDEIRKLAKTFMCDPVVLDVSQDTLTVESVHQGYVSVDPRDKFATLLGFLKHENPKLAIVFTNTKAAARRVAQRLKAEGVSCKEIHGDLVQSHRERVMKSFRGAQIQVLVATDLASRGLDVMEVSHIVNYDVPQDASAYVHRIGRTARMGNRGYAVTFVGPEHGDLLTEIEKLINQEVPQLDAPWVVRRHRREPQLQPATQTSPPLAPGPMEPPRFPHTPARFTEALRRCGILDAHGLRPIKRTLGSRFRSSRRRR